MTLSFDGQRAYDHIKHLSVDIGPRTMGSDAEKRAADYIRSYHEGLGLEVQEQTFEVEGASLIDHKMEVLEPALGEILSRPVLLTPDTPEKGLTGELVFVEGSQEPQVGPHLAGKIVLWSMSRSMEFWRNYRALARHRPLAIVTIYPALGVKPKHFHITEEVAKPYDRVTSFFIAWEDGLRLLRGGAKKARLHLRSKRYESTSRNIIAELEGSDHPEEIIVVGGHYDSVPDLSGATDNASGIATVMELARLYAERGSKRTLRFVAWGGEEGGMLGSRHYIEELKKQGKEERAADDFVEGRDRTELERHLCCVNLDVLGMSLGHNVFYVLAPPEVATAINFLAKELGVPHEVKEAFYGSDGEPFALAGVPAISFAREGAAATYMHTPEDAIDIVDEAQLQRIGAFVDTFLTRTAAYGQVWPFQRRIPDKPMKEIREILEKIGWSYEENRSEDA